MNRRESIRQGLLAALALAAVTAPVWLPSYYVQLSTRSLILALVAMSFILLAGYGGMISLAQMSFFAMAGYVIGVGVMDHGWPFAMAIPAAIAGATLLSAAFALIAIRVKGIYFLMMTLALSQLSYGVALQWASVTRGWDGFSGITRPTVFGWSLIETNPLFYLTLIVFVSCYLMLRRLVRSPFGLALQGIRDNPVRMGALGYNVRLHRFLVLVISGVFPGIAGVLGVFYYGGVSPATTGLSQIMLVVMAAIAGGVSSIEGGLVGAFITVFLTSIASQYTQHYTTIIGLVFVLLILFLPGGVLGSRKQLELLVGGLRARLALRGSVRAPAAKPANPPNAVNATSDVPASQGPGGRKPADPGQNRGLGSNGT